MTNKNDIKNAIDDIQPDIYMKTRLKAKVGDYKRPNSLAVLKRAGAGVLALAVFCASLGTYSALNKNNDDGTADFTIIAYAADENNGKVETPLTEDKITLPNVRLEKDESDGNGIQQCSGGFIVDAENIDTITIKSEHGEFLYWDTAKQDYDERVKGVINFIKIPLTDEEYADYKENFYSGIYYNREKDSEFAKKILDSKDCKKYFGKNSMNLKLYDFDVVSKDKSTDGINQLILQNVDLLYDRYYHHTDEAECVIKQYDSKEKVEIGYLNNDVLDYFNDDKLNVSDTPNDTITITVKFDDGQKVTKRLNISFNSDAVMEVEFIK